MTDINFSSSSTLEGSGPFTPITDLPGPDNAPSPDQTAPAIQADVSAPSNLEGRGPLVPITDLPSPDKDPTVDHSAPLPTSNPDPNPNPNPNPNPDPTPDPASGPITTEDILANPSLARTESVRTKVDIFKNQNPEALDSYIYHHVVPLLSDLGSKANPDVDERYDLKEAREQYDAYQLLCAERHVAPFFHYGRRLQKDQASQNLGDLDHLVRLTTDPSNIRAALDQDERPAFDRLIANDPVAQKDYVGRLVVSRLRNVPMEELEKDWPRYRDTFAHELYHLQGPVDEDTFYKASNAYLNRQKAQVDTYNATTTGVLDQGIRGQSFDTIRATLKDPAYLATSKTVLDTLHQSASPELLALANDTYNLTATANKMPGALPPARSADQIARTYQALPAQDRSTYFGLLGVMADANHLDRRNFFEKALRNAITEAPPEASVPAGLLDDDGTAFRLGLGMLNRDELTGDLPGANARALMFQDKLRDNLRDTIVENRGASGPLQPFSFLPPVTGTPLRPEEEPVNRASTALPQMLIDSGMYGSATDASTSAWHKTIEKKDGVWTGPPITSSTPFSNDGWVNEEAGAAWQSINSFFGRIGATSDNLDGVLSNLQKQYNLSDSQMKTVWSDFITIHRKFDPAETARLLSTGRLVPNGDNSDWLDDAKARDIIASSAASPFSKQAAFANLPALQKAIVRNKLESYEAAAQLDATTRGISGYQAAAFPAPSVWASQHQPPITNLYTKENVLAYENEVINPRSTLDKWDIATRASALKGWNKIALQAMSLAAMCGSDSAAESVADMQQFLGQANRGLPDIGLAGNLIEEAPSIFTQIVLTHGIGAGTAALTGSADVVKAANTISAIAIAGGQSATSTFAEALGQGDTREQALDKARKAGVNTALLTGLFGTGQFGGIESVAAGRAEAVTIGDLFKIAQGKGYQGLKELGASPQFRRFATDLITSTGGQVTQQGLDTLTTTFLNAAPDTNLADAWDNTLHSMATAAVLTPATHLAHGLVQGEGQPGERTGNEAEVGSPDINLHEGSGILFEKGGNPKPNPRVNEDTPVPSMIRPLDASSPSGEDTASHGTGIPDAANPATSRDPGTVRESLRRGSQAEASTAPDDGAGSLRTNVEKRRKPGREIISASDVSAWAEHTGHRLDPLPFVEKLGEQLPAGGEHTVIDDPESGRVVKLTKPGFFGAQGEDFGAYLDRWDKHNRAFGDDTAFEGFVTLPGEDAPRAVISQEAVKGRDATPEELRNHLIQKGFYEVEPDRWIHPVHKLAVWDTQTPGNAIRAEDGSIHPIDLQAADAPRDDIKALQERGIGRDTAFSHSEGEPFHDADLPETSPANLVPESKQPVDLTPAEQQARLDQVGPDIAKGLGRPELADAFRNATGKDQQKVTGATRFATAIAKLFGKNVVIYSHFKGAPTGFVHPDHPDTVFLSSANKRPHFFTTGHELWHHLETHHPDIAARVRQQLEPLIQNREQLAAEKPGYDRDQHVSELIADFLGDNFARPEFWNGLAEKQPGIFKEAARVVTGWLNQVLDALKNKGYGSERYFSDLSKARDVITHATVEFAERQHWDSLTPEAKARIVKDRIAHANNEAKKSTADMNLDSLRRIGNFWKQAGEIEGTLQFPKDLHEKSVEDLTRRMTKVIPGITATLDTVLSQGGDKTWDIRVGRDSGYLHDTAKGVFVDTSGINPGDDAFKDPSKRVRGSAAPAVYQIAEAYARNNGKKFIPDPHSVSEVARPRRIAQMLASAIRFGDTSHLDPHDKHGPEVEHWTHGKDVPQDIGRLAHHEADFVKYFYPEIQGLRFNHDWSRILDSHGTDVTDRIAENFLTGRRDPTLTGIGYATLRRAIATLTSETRGRQLHGKTPSGSNGERGIYPGGGAYSRPNMGGSERWFGDGPAGKAFKGISYSFDHGDGPLKPKVANHR